MRLKERLLAMACAIGPAVVLTGPAAAAVGLPVVHPGQTVHLSGTRIYCDVVTSRGDVYASCSVTKPGTKLAVGYSFTIGDKAVAVSQVVAGKTPLVFGHTQPALQLGAAGATGNGTGTLTMHLGDQVVVGGTHVTLVAGKNAEKEPGLVAVIPDSHRSPVNRSYIAGISEGRIVVLMWKSGAGAPVFKKLEPSIRRTVPKPKA